MKRAIETVLGCWVVFTVSCSGTTDEPRLCVQSVSTQDLSCLPDPTLTRDTPIEVTHVLPPHVDPYGNKVELSLRAAGVDERQSVEYVRPADAGVQMSATAVFAFPADGGCVVVVTASVLNVAQEVIAHVDGCQ